MSHYVIEENVAIVANGDKTPQADSACKLKVIEKLEKIMSAGVAVVDDAGEITSKYCAKGKLVKQSQPNTGFVFLKWLLEHQFNKTHVHRVAVGKEASGEFSKFPKTIKSFDPSDRIFVATALEHGDAIILNAVDNDYALHKTELDKASVVIEELCPHCLKP